MDIVSGQGTAGVVRVLAAAALSLVSVVGVAAPQSEAAPAPLEGSPPRSAIEPPSHRAHREARLRAARLDALRRRSPRRLSPAVKPHLDRTGHARFGKASFYAHMFAGRKMADGTPMRPTANNAASRTLPLGTTAKVTNLETGKTAVVTIRDRGPYIEGRIVDLSPATARKIGLDRRTGVTEVEVAPLVVPLANGKVKLGDGILEADNNTKFASSLR